MIVGIDDQTLTAPGHIFPFSRKFHAQVIRNLAKADAKVIAYDVAVHAGERKPRRRLRAHPGRAARRSAGRAGHRRGRRGRRDADLRRRPRPEIQPRQPGVLVVREGRGRGPAPAALQRERPEGLPDRRRREVHRTQDRPAAARARTGSTSRAARRRSSTSASSTSRKATFDPADVRGKIVVVGATATDSAGHPRDVDDQPAGDGRARGPRQRDHHGARRLPAAERARIGSTCCSSSLLGVLGPARSRSGCGCSSSSRSAILAIAGARWSAPSSPSRTS